MKKFLVLSLCIVLCLSFSGCRDKYEEGPNVAEKLEEYFIIHHMRDDGDSFGKAIKDVSENLKKDLFGMSETKTTVAENHVKSKGDTTDAEVSGLSEWNTSKVTNMSSMFQGINQDIDVSYWNTSNVKDMSAMFRGELSIEETDRGTVEEDSKEKREKRERKDNDKDNSALKQLQRRVLYRR